MLGSRSESHWMTSKWISWPLYMQGFPTVRSYAPELESRLRDEINQQHGGSLGERIQVSVSAEDFWAHVPDDHVHFLHRLRRYHVEREGGGIDPHGYLFAHAGIDPTVSRLEDQTEEALFWQNTAALIETWHGPETLVVGHVGTHRVLGSLRGEVLLLPHLIMLDTGCPGTGVLSAVQLPDRKVFQARRDG
jgi:hypothetical protein